MQVAVAPARQQVAQTILLLLALLFLLGLTLVPHPENTPGVRLLMLLLAATLAYVFWAAPRRLSYTLGDSALTLHFLLGQTRLPYAEVQARRTTGRLGLRVGGTGLPGYYTGYFTLQGDEVRSVSAAASNRDGGVLVQASGKTFFLTPADPEGFLRELAARGAKVVA